MPAAEAELDPSAASGAHARGLFCAHHPCRTFASQPAGQARRERADIRQPMVSAPRPSGRRARTGRCALSVPRARSQDERGRSGRRDPSRGRRAEPPHNRPRGIHANVSGRELKRAPPYFPARVYITRARFLLDARVRCYDLSQAVRARVRRARTSCAKASRPPGARLRHPHRVFAYRRRLAAIFFTAGAAPR